ncbi:MAG: hypothetical protein AABX95_04705 [Nanoarchaeota archaeon]
MLFRAWNTSSIQKSSTNQTTHFSGWWCIDFLILIPLRHKNKYLEEYKNYI